MELEEEQEELELVELTLKEKISGRYFGKKWEEKTNNDNSRYLAELCCESIYPNIKEYDTEIIFIGIPWNTMIFENYSFLYQISEEELHQIIINECSEKSTLFFAEFIKKSNWNKDIFLEDLGEFEWILKPIGFIKPQIIFEKCSKVFIKNKKKKPLGGSMFYQIHKGYFELKLDSSLKSFKLQKNLDENIGKRKRIFELNKLEFDKQPINLFINLTRSFEMRTFDLIDRAKLRMDLLNFINNNKKNENFENELQKKMENNLFCKIISKNSKDIPMVDFENESFYSREQEDIASWVLLHWFAATLHLDQNFKEILIESECYLLSFRLKYQKLEEKDILDMIERERLIGRKFDDLFIGFSKLEKFVKGEKEAEILFKRKWPQCPSPTKWFLTSVFNILDWLPFLNIFVLDGIAFISYKHLQEFLFEKFYRASMRNLLLNPEIKKNLENDFEFIKKQKELSQETVENQIIIPKMATPEELEYLKPMIEENKKFLEKRDQKLPQCDLFQQGIELAEHIQSVYQGIKKNRKKQFETKNSSFLTEEMTSWEFPDIEDLGKNQKAKVPLCITTLLDKLNRIGNLKHKERFHLTGFLLNSHFPQDNIIHFFQDKIKGTDKYDREKKFKEIQQSYIQTRLKNEFGYAETGCKTYYDHLEKFQKQAPGAEASGCPFREKDSKQLDHLLKLSGILTQEKRNEIISVLNSDLNDKSSYFNACERHFLILHGFPNDFSFQWKSPSKFYIQSLRNFNKKK